MGRVPRWVVIAAAVIIVVSLGKGIVAKAAVTGGVKAMTGLDLRIHAMDVGLLRTAVGIRGMTLRNPAGFPDPIMLDLPEIFVDYDLFSLFSKRVHLEEVRLTLKEFVVVKNAEGQVNLDALKMVQESKGATPASRGGAGPAQLHIDRLRLKVGTVVYKDYAAGGEPRIQAFPVNLDEEYRNITNPQALAALVVSRALMNTTVAKLAGVDLTAIQGQVGAQIEKVTAAATAAASAAAKQAHAASAQVTGAAAQAASGAQAAAAGAAKVGKEALGTATGAAAGAVKGTAVTLKKILPFGGDGP